MARQALFEQLEKAGFLRGTKVRRAVIGHASLSKLLDMAVQSCDLTSAKGQPRNEELLVHSASRGLGGSPAWCAALECRLKRANNLSHFASLYSDRVYVSNVFEDLLASVEHGSILEEDVVRQIFADDVEILGYLRPCIEAGVIVPVTPPHYCVRCLAEHSFGHGTERKLRDAFNSLNRRMDAEISVEAERLSSGVDVVAVTGPEELLEHGFAGLFSSSTSGLLDATPRINARLRRDGKIKVSRWAARKVGIPQLLAERHINSIVFQLSLAQCLGTRFLTEMPLHVELLKQMSSVPSQVERDCLIEKHLTCLVPFADELKPSQILELRKHEEDAFIRFRAALARAVDEYRTSYGRFTESDAKALHGDVLRPSLAQLAGKVRHARHLLVRKSFRRTALWTGLIAFGAYCGFMPEALRSVAGVLGLTKILSELVEGAMRIGDATDEGKLHDMYFLWQVERKAKRS